MEYPIDNEPIILEQSKSADSRTIDHDITPEELLASSKQHIGDVIKIMNYMAERIKETAKNHDYTKINPEDFKAFYESFALTQKNQKEGKPDNFKERDWFQKHITEERHHIDAYQREDINLFDVMEHIADIVAAAIGRYGKFDFDRTNIDPEILETAFYNTIGILLEKVKLKEEIK